MSLKPVNSTKILEVAWEAFLFPILASRIRFYSTSRCQERVFLGRGTIFLILGLPKVIRSFSAYNNKLKGFATFWINQQWRIRTKPVSLSEAENHSSGMLDLLVSTVMKKSEIHFYWFYLWRHCDHGGLAEHTPSTAADSHVLVETSPQEICLHNQEPWAFCSWCSALLVKVFGQVLLWPGNSCVPYLSVFCCSTTSFFLFVSVI